MNDPKDLALKLMRAAFPEARKRKVAVDLTGRCLFYNLHWSEGCRNHYIALSLDGQRMDQLGPSSRAPWNEPLEGATVDVPQGVAIAVYRMHGTTTSAVVHFNKEDFPS